MGSLVGLLILLTMPLCNGSFDLYVEREDAKNLLGVASQLWYVKEGRVNYNALNYAILIPPHINILTFYWQNHIESTMPYSLEIDISNSYAIHKPKLKNIKKKGLVPNQLTAWGITINCTGRFVTQSHINITLRVPLIPSLHNITTVIIQRKKICTEKNTGSIAVEPILVHKSTSIVYITVGFLAFFLISVASFVAFNHIRAAKLRSRNARTRASTQVPHHTPPVPNNQRDGQPSATSGKESKHSLAKLKVTHPCANAGSATTGSTTVITSEIVYKDPREGDIPLKLKALKGRVDLLTINDISMEGTFGRIHNGTYCSDDQETPYPVVIKTVSECASEVQRGVLIAEGVMMAGLVHERILPIVAAITEPEMPPLIVFRSSMQINLKKYLQGCHTLLTRDVVFIGTQVLEGLSFLHSQFLLHKDIACRNCVVDENLSLQLTDCALSRDIFPSDYHCLGDNENRPVKWLAIESLSNKVFSPASDVWSWGVLLWEVMTLGQQPYVEIDPFEMVSVLLQGVRLAQPINCPDELFKAMTFCWTSIPNERPTVSELQLYLKTFLHHLQRYV